MEENAFIKQYTLSDLFDGTFKLLKFTWKNTLIICGICFVPLTFMTVFFLSEYYKIFADFFASEFSTDMEAITDRLLSYSWFLWFILLYVLVVGIVTLFVKAVIVVTVFRSIQGESLDLKDVVHFVLTQKLGKLFIQSILLFLIILGMIIAGGLLIGLLSFISMMIHPGFGIFIIIISYIGFLCIIFWFMISFSFIQEEVIYSNISASAGFKKSFNLVKGNWWRVLGILLVFGIALSFFISIVTTPITFSFTAPLYSKMFESLLNEGSMSDLYRSIFSMYANAGVAIYFSSLLSMVFSYFISPLFSSLLFLDLKYRKKEIGHPPTESSDSTLLPEIELTSESDSYDGE
ncbi:MAG: hypothetical protein JXJ04_05600 [Spirochaetales bacterium]|nr:hypothetical protein [Spirochaetales bacterium]